jgi:hypothetical protein
MEEHKEKFQPVLDTINGYWKRPPFFLAHKQKNEIQRYLYYLNTHDYLRGLHQ